MIATGHPRSQQLRYALLAIVFELLLKVLRRALAQNVRKGAAQFRQTIAKLLYQQAG